MEKAKLGRLSHVGIVVRDMDQAIEYYGSVFGLGPWRIEVYDLPSFTFRGRPGSARVKAALADSGQVFLELVQVLEGETVHTEFLKERGEGLQHVAFLVRDLDEKLKDLARSGVEPAMIIRLPVAGAAGESGGAAGRAMELTEVYLDSEKIGGTMIQLMEFRERPGPRS